MTVQIVNEAEIITATQQWDYTMERFASDKAETNLRKVNNQKSDYINLETAVEREKDVSHIDVRRKFEKLLVTLLVM